MWSLKNSRMRARTESWEIPIIEGGMGEVVAAVGTKKN